METIGDSYMVVSGLPERTEKHAAEAALLSLDLLQQVNDFHIPHFPEERLKLRIGLHSGNELFVEDHDTVFALTCFQFAWLIHATIVLCKVSSISVIQCT